jgi:metal-sulfur cluster biosynthetic enzyme
MAITLLTDDEIMQVLRRINDPELGINIVDLGLVYRITRSPERVDVALTLTTPSCPLGEMLVIEATEELQRHFPDGPPIHVELVWDPPWTPERMSEAARQQIG